GCPYTACRPSRAAPPGSSGTAQRPRRPLLRPWPVWSPWGCSLRRSPARRRRCTARPYAGPRPPARTERGRYCRSTAPCQPGLPSCTAPPPAHPSPLSCVLCGPAADAHGGHGGFGEDLLRQSGVAVFLGPVDRAHTCGHQQLGAGGAGEVGDVAHRPGQADALVGGIGYGVGLGVDAQLARGVTAVLAVHHALGRTV